MMNSDYVVIIGIIVDQVEYLVYDSKGNKLDISVCKEKNVTISISYPIDIDDDVKEAAKDMLNDGIDVFNSKDEFFNDICSTYVTENNTDVILKDRRADFYKNFSSARSVGSLMETDLSVSAIAAVANPMDLSIVSPSAAHLLSSQGR